MVRDDLKKTIWYLVKSVASRSQAIGIMVRKYSMAPLSKGSMTGRRQPISSDKVFLCLYLVGKTSHFTPKAENSRIGHNDNNYFNLY